GCRDWPKPFSESVWLLRDPASPTDRNPPSGHGCPPPGTGIASVPRSAQRFHPCARWMASASRFAAAVGEAPARSAVPNATWRCGPPGRKQTNGGRRAEVKRARMMQADSPLIVIVYVPAQPVKAGSATRRVLRARDLGTMRLRQRLGVNNL